MLFNFQLFIGELRDTADKQESVTNYERIYGPITGDIFNQIWYKEYVSLFPAATYLVPEELRDDFDWDLLCRLTAASFSSEGYLFPKESGLDLLIKVQSSDQVVKKVVSELWGFQVLRLYEIFCEEHLNLQLLIGTDDDQYGADEEAKLEKKAISATRNLRLDRWKREILVIPTKQYLSEVEKKIQATLSL